MVVGGIAVGGTVAIGRAQQNHAVQTDEAVSQLNVHKLDCQSCTQAPGGGSPQASRTDEIVPVSESGTIWCLDTVPGSIEQIEFVIGTPLPLCITNETLSAWHGLYNVYGGYTPYDGYVNVWQKHVIVGQIYLTWTQVPDDSCYFDVWSLTYYVKSDICLDSNQYPTMTGDGVIGAPYQTIPGKAVNLEYVTDWKGCHQRDQSFTILPVQ